MAATNSFRLMLDAVKFPPGVNRDQSQVCLEGRA